MNIQINNLLESKGKTRYWLAKQVGMTHQNLTKLANNKTESIKFESLEKICLALECSPNDILGWDK
ncbi:TPA: helix-turn-helix domain-containing protein [Clostridioides difficile]|uniref:helix-turn-helix domain-containing protein n=1 Tax=Clostridioides difficile TaxID=1496 RepID=UPI00097FE771|nr:helix-turn-helix domain-containing protein [Clostridioides difficile]MDK3306586.1 helix-turn-helix domain-containing protein [Clostridioides difficile]MDV9712518.1 helix-turn-helix domain-containing protein [Clostridioides difficile]SJT87793.1 Predicted transcriptional regulator [Clostridioides difficile]HBF6471974.1 helix-turn-helix domain-containing protein [Clostridioides difficile]